MQKLTGQLKTIFNLGWPYLSPYRTRFALGAILGVLFGLSHGLYPLVTNILLSRISIDPQKTQDLPQAPELSTDLIAKLNEWLDPFLPSISQPLTLVSIICGILIIPILNFARGTLAYLSKYFIGWSTERFIRDLRCAILDKLTRLSLTYYQGNTTGDLHTSLDKDTQNLYRTFLLVVPDVIREPCILLGAVGGMILIDWKLAVLGFVFLPLCSIPVVILGKKVKKASLKQRATGVSQSSHILQALANIRVIKSFSLEKMQHKEYKEISDQLIVHNMRIIKSRALINPIIETIAALAIGLILIYIIYEKYQIPELGSFIMAMILAYSPVKKLAAVNMLIQQTHASVTRLQSLLSEKPSIYEKANAHQLHRFEKNIQFHNISFTYDQSPTLQNISLKINKGEKVGLVGESGSGKSTLANLMLRFYDVHEGSLTIDGHDIRDVTLKSLLHQIAFVGQEVLLFNKSVAENILCGRPNAHQDEIIFAARAADAHNFIEALPNGYDTVIGEYGFKLSGGQRQRLAIARAFIRNAPILILDEATAALDSESESEIQAAIDKLSKDRTVMAIAHRLSTLKKFDRIYFLENGKLLAHGTFKELMQTTPAFSKLASQQGIN